MIGKRRFRILSGVAAICEVADPVLGLEIGLGLDLTGLDESLAEIAGLIDITVDAMTGRISCCSADSTLYQAALIIGPRVKNLRRPTC